MSDYAKGGNVERALQRLMAQLKQDPELAPQVSHLQAQAEEAVPRVAEPTENPTAMQLMAQHVIENNRPQNRPPLSAQQLVQRLQGNQFVDPAELQHLLYSEPGATSAINAYQGAVDKNAVTPEVRQALAAALNKQIGLGPSVLNPNEYDEGGPVEPFDPIQAAIDRVHGSSSPYVRPGDIPDVHGTSSPSSPGVSGAIKDAISALQGLVNQGRQQFADESQELRLKQIDEQSQAEGGSVVDGRHDRGLGNRFITRVKEQAYGLDASGKPALGGRAWLPGQGGTPMGLLDEIFAAPHNLIQLYNTLQGPAPKDTYDSHTIGVDENGYWKSPQWSQDASNRLDQLRAAMNKQEGVSEAHTLPEHLTDAAASLVSPIPMTKAGREASIAKRLLEMTTPLRPRTVKDFVTDTALLGGIGYGADSAADRLEKLRAQQANPPLDPNALPTKDPATFSSSMGLTPVEGSEMAEGGKVSRRGFLGALAMAPVALKALRDRIIEAPETSAVRSPAMPNPEVSRRLAEAKKALFGHGDDIRFEEAFNHIKGIPNSENALKKLTAMKALWDNPQSAEDILNGYHRPLFLDAEHSLDELATAHGEKPVPNPELGGTMQQNDLAEHGSITPHLDRLVESTRSDPELNQQVVNFRDSVAKHLQETGHSESGLIGKYFVEGDNPSHPFFDLHPGLRDDDTGFMDILQDHLENH